jgi:Flp pilus assembly protein TadD
LSAHRLARTDPERALKQIRRALKRYKRVDPSQRSLALKKEAAILEQLGRPAEAAEALKKSHAIQPAD